jgi:hypothetical protein
LEQINTVWLTPVNVCNSAHAISAKFKLLRRTLKLWPRTFPIYQGLLQIVI